MARSGIMLACPFEEKRLLKWKPPYIVQPKLDGVRCRAVMKDPNIFPPRFKLLSSEENEIVSVPHITGMLNNLRIPDEELDGELYIHGMSFDNIFSITSREINLHPDYIRMEYHVFDRVSEHSQAHRISGLPELKNPIKAVPFEIAENLEDVLRAYDRFVDMGYEGIIVRNIYAPYVRKRSVNMMKFKPKKEDYYKIVGYKEEISIHGERKGTLGALECVSDGTTFSVGSGFKQADRRTLWRIRESLVGKLAKVQYQHITPGRKVPRFPVFVEIIEAEPEEVGLKI